jgi:multiple sugar transport system permease protein
MNLEMKKSIFLRTPWGKKIKIRKLNARDSLYGFLFISPMVLGYILFVLGPMIVSFVMSFTDWKVVGDTHFVGIANYTQAFKQDPLFWKSFWNTLYYTLGVVPLNVILALFLALLLTNRLPGIGLFRTAIFTPVVTSVVVWAIMWKFIFQTENGLINIVLNLFHITGPAWLYDLKFALPVVIFISVLKGVGYNMVIFLAALNDVPKLFYEAARIDGASKWKTFWHVTLPLISPSVFLVVILTMIGSLKIFGQIYVLTGGGPGTSTYVFVYYIYELAFRVFELGYASAIGFILFTIILLLTIIQWIARKRWVHYED